MPHPLAAGFIGQVHNQFYSSDYVEAIQIFSGGDRLLNQNGDNPMVLNLPPEQKMMLGLTEYVQAYRVRVLGRGIESIDEMCSPSSAWTLSLDGGETTQPYQVAGTIGHDASMTCWEFVLYSANG